MSTPSYGELQEKYGGQFVAIRDGEILAAGKSYRDLREAIERAGHDPSQLTLEYIEPADALRA